MNPKVMEIEIIFLDMWDVSATRFTHSFPGFYPVLNRGTCLTRTKPPKVGKIMGQKPHTHSPKASILHTLGAQGNPTPELVKGIGR